MKLKARALNRMILTGHAGNEHSCRLTDGSRNSPALPAPKSSYKAFLKLHTSSFLPMANFSFEKIWFVLSLSALTFLYGTAVGKWEWFPHSYLNRAVDQARAVFGSSNEATIFIGPRVYDRVGVRAVRSGKMQPGLTLISSSWKGPEGWNPELRLINKKGQVLHRWRINRKELFQGGIIQRRNPNKAGVHGSYLLPDGNVVVNLEYVGMARLNACGDVVWTLAEGNHHSIARAEDGSFWTPGVSPERRAQTPRHPDGFPGLERPVWMDRVLHVSEDGEAIDQINVLDVLYANDLDRYLPKGMGPQVQKIGTDPVHLNDVEPLSSALAEEYPFFEAGDLLISLLFPDLVFVFDPESGGVKWYESRYFTGQHDPDFMGSGWIGVFDNRRDFTKRGAMLGGTRIVALQPHTDSMKVLFPTRHSEPFYTAAQGKWQELENGNMLLAETTAGRIVEVDPNGHTVWEWVRAPISDSKVTSVTKATRVDLTRREIASWPCSSVDSARVSATKQ